MKKRALITGVTGQDGAYLAQQLLSRGYEVWGTSRDAQLSSFTNLERLGIRDAVKTLSMAPNDFRSVLTGLSASEPGEVYFLAGQSSVGLSFEQPAETIESIAIGALNFLEAIRIFDKKIKFYHASSSECFGDVGESPADESMPFRPRSPYAIAKASAHWLVSNYRESYGLFACNGILFNHESPLRPARFVTQKIIRTALQIAAGSRDSLTLGRLDIARDWGWAPEYVEAMWLMLQQADPEDYVVATGEAHTLKVFVKEAFEGVGLDWEKHVTIDPSLFRPADITWSQGNPKKAEIKLGWTPKKKMKDVILAMIEAERAAAVSHSKQ